MMYIQLNCIYKFEGECKMGKFQSDAQQLLKAVGGKENISAVSHCATRMRFVLKDPKKRMYL